VCEKRKYEEIWLVEVVVLFDEEILLTHGVTPFFEVPW